MKRFLHDRSAATSIEYGAMVAVLGVAILLGGSKLRDLVGSSLTQLTGAGDMVRVSSCAPGEKCPSPVPATAGQGGAGVAPAR